MANKENNADDLLTVAQAAAQLGLSTRRVTTLCRDQRLGKRFGGKVYLISRQELDEFAKTPRRPGPRKGQKRKLPEKSQATSAGEPTVKDKDWNKIGEWICQQREVREMFQRELADKTGVFQPDVCFWEKGVHVPDTKACVQLAKVFGADVRDVLGMAMETNLVRQIQKIDET